MEKSENTMMHMAFFAFCIILLLLSNNFMLNEWRATQWLFSYDEFFSKRGLLGDILFNLCSCSSVSIETLQAITRLIVVVLSLLVTGFICHGFRDNIFLGFNILLAGFCIQQFSFEIGRFEHITYILTFIGILIYLLRPGGLTLIVNIFLAILMLLIHEASALINIPLFFTMLLLGKQKKQYKHAFIYLAATIIFFVVIISFEGVNGLSRHEYSELLALKAENFKPSQAAINIQYRTLQDNFQYALDRWQKPSTPSSMSLIFIISIIPLYIIYSILRSLQEKENIEMIVIILIPVVSILPLFFLGRDFYRWIALTQLNFFIVMSLYLWQRKCIFYVNKKLLKSWVLVSIYAGGYGASTVLPDRLHLIGF